MNSTYDTTLTASFILYVSQSYVNVSNHFTCTKIIL